MDLRDRADQMEFYEKRSSCVVEKGVNGHLFERNTKTFLNGPNGNLVTKELATLTQVDCGHVIGARGAQELLGKCQKCGKNWVCFRCEARCTRCRKLLCPACVKKTTEGNVFCSGCRRIETLKHYGRRLHESLAK